MRRLARNGNSLTVALPRQALNGMGVMRSDWIEVVYDDETHVTTLRAVERRDVQPEIPRHSNDMVAVRG